MSPLQCPNGRSGNGTGEEGEDTLISCPKISTSCRAQISVTRLSLPLPPNPADLTSDLTGSGSLHEKTKPHSCSGGQAHSDTHIVTAF